MNIWNWVTSRDGRKWLYTVSVALIPLLVFYGVITEDAAPLFIALIGSIFAPAMALAHLTPPPTGHVDGANIPDDLPQNVELDVETP